MIILKSRLFVGVYEQGSNLTKSEVLNSFLKKKILSTGINQPIAFLK